MWLNEAIKSTVCVILTEKAEFSCLRSCAYMYQDALLSIDNDIFNNGKVENAC